MFQTKAAAMTKAQSSIEERWVAGMVSKDYAAERKCLWPDTSATRCMDDRYPGEVLLTHWNINVASLKVIRSGTQSQWS